MSKFLNFQKKVPSKHHRNESFKLFWFVLFEMLYLTDHLTAFLLPCKYLTAIHPEPKSRILQMFSKWGY